MALAIESPRFGHVEIDPETVIEFPDGLIGLGGSRYALLTSDPDSPIVWLHCIDDPTLSLPVTDPHRFFSDYQVELTDEDGERLGLDDSTPVDVFVTVVAASGAVGLHRQPEGADPDLERPGPPDHQPGPRLRPSRPPVRRGPARARPSPAAPNAQHHPPPRRADRPRRRRVRLRAGGQRPDSAARHRGAALPPRLPRGDLAGGQARERGGGPCRQCGAAATCRPRSRAMPEPATSPATPSTARPAPELKPRRRSLLPAGAEVAARAGRGCCRRRPRLLPAGAEVAARAGRSCCLRGAGGAPQSTPRS